MRICYVVPGDFSSRPDGAAELERRQSILRSWAFPGTDVSVADVRNGIQSIESAYEELLAAPAGIERIRELEREGWDAAIIGCFGDPGLAAARELVSIPVVGPGEASLLVAAQLGHRIGIITVFDRLAELHRGQAFRAGVLDKLCSIRGIDLPVLQLARDPGATFDRLVTAGRAAIEVDRADALILGCMSMAFMDLAGMLSKILQIPVVNPAQAALKAAEGLVAMSLSHKWSTRSDDELGCVPN